jgi:GMP synthase-like glutamine amidotransferase
VHIQSIRKLSNEIYGNYGKIVQTCLERGYERHPGQRLDLNFSFFDVVELNYPSDVDLQNINAIVVTGSATGAYSKDPWTLELTQQLKHIFLHHSQIKLVGICFGHQIIAHALTNLEVILNPKGWEMGVYSVDLSEADLSPLSGRSSYKIQMVHQDIVVGQPSGDWKVLGFTEKCSNQGLYLENRVLSVQGHFEFDCFITKEEFKVIDPVIPEAEKLEMLNRIEQQDDAEWVIDAIVSFLIVQ